MRAYRRVASLDAVYARIPTAVDTERLKGAGRDPLFIFAEGHPDKGVAERLGTRRRD